MKHNITITNEISSEYFEIETEFNTAKISNIKYSNQNDCPNLLVNWLHGRFGEIFSIPVSQKYSYKNQFDLIEMAKDFDEPYNGPYNWLDIKIENEFIDESS